MRVHHSNINAFLFTPNRYFEIPDFQRPYSWTSNNIEAFLDDLEKTLESGQSHYFGSVVYIVDGKESTIIDGQQRATTVLLMITALYHLISENPSKSSLPAEQLMENFLINRYGDEKNRIKLRTVTVDDEIFKKIFEKKIESPREKESKLYNAYIAFYEYFSDKDQLEKYVDILEKFEIVDILLEPSDDNPQKIFESINSTGEPLTDGDKIRNFALMLSDKQARELVFNNYWKRVERELTDVDSEYITDFFRAFMTAKFGRDVKLYNVYKEFKEYFSAQVPHDENEIDNLNRFYTDIDTYLDFFILMKFTDRQFPNEYLPFADQIFRLNYLKVEVTYPFLMKVLSRFKQGELSGKDVHEILEVIEAFLVRRIICSIATTGLNKRFATLDRDIENYLADSPEASYLEIFKYALLEKQRAQRFPHDNEVSKSIEVQPIYEQRSHNVNFILTSIDDKKQSKESFLLKRIATGDKTLSIEHILPQTLSESWREALGDDSNEKHVRYLHTLANLTITGYNSKYSNRSFQEKKTIDNGFNHSPLTINAFIKEQDTWGIEQLETRTIWWQGQVNELWPLPKTKYTLPSNTITISLNDEDSLVGREIRSVSVLGQKYQVTTWVEAIDSISECLYDKDSQIVQKISEDEFLSRYIKHNSEELKSPVEIYDTGLFVETHMHNDRKRSFLLKLLECLDYEPDSIEFEVTKQKFKRGNDQNEYQLKFWDVFTQALQISKNDIFTGVPSPRAQHWLNIPIGTSKAHVEMTIVQNPQKFVGVELYISNNSTLFNHLHENKEAIETQLGEELIWDEIPDKKASRIKLRKEADYIESLMNDDDQDLREIIDWMVSKANQFAEVFIKYI